LFRAFRVFRGYISFATPETSKKTEPRNTQNKKKNQNTEPNLERRFSCLHVSESPRRESNGSHTILISDVALALVINIPQFSSRIEFAELRLSP
jgi:hypothetical protein